MNKLPLLFLLLTFSTAVFAQNTGKYCKNEPQLQELMQRFTQDTLLENRNEANYDFIKLLVQSLKEDNSFLFGFDSLKYISVLQPEDKSFKIFTWQVKQYSGTYRHFGCIQMNSPQLKLVSLIDQSDNLLITDTVLSAKNWIGTVYYKIKTVKKGSKKYYTLLGYDEFEPFTERKIIELLWFDKDKTPYFGAPVIELEGTVVNRLTFEYREDISMALRFFQLKNASERVIDEFILIDHLVAEHKDMEGLSFDYVPDGTYDALRWKKGKWVYESNIDLQKK